MALPPIQFHHFLGLPKEMRRDIAGFVLSCAKRTIMECAGKVPPEEVAKMRPVGLAVGFLHLIEQGIAQIEVEGDGRVFLRQAKNVKVVRIHSVH